MSPHGAGVLVLDRHAAGLEVLEAQKDALRGVLHPAWQREVRGKPVHEGPEPDPLNRPADHDPQPLARHGCGAVA